MIQKTRYRISLAERTSIGKLILAQQPVISFAAALAQVQRLKKISQQSHHQERAGSCTDTLHK
jgi:hypothetical protein